MRILGADKVPFVLFLILFLKMQITDFFSQIFITLAQNVDCFMCSFFHSSPQPQTVELLGGVGGGGELDL
jgi:hypothetical protein